MYHEFQITKLRNPNTHTKKSQSPLGKIRFQQTLQNLILNMTLNNTFSLFVNFLI